MRGSKDHAVFVNPGSIMDPGSIAAGIKRMRITNAMPHVSLMMEPSWQSVVIAIRNAVTRGGAHYHCSLYPFADQLKRAADPCHNLSWGYLDGTEAWTLAEVADGLQKIAVNGRPEVIQSACYNPEVMPFLTGVPAGDQGSIPLRDFVADRLDMLRGTDRNFPPGVWNARRGIEWIQAEKLSMTDWGWLLTEVARSGRPLTFQVSTDWLYQQTAIQAFIASWVMTGN